MHYVMQVRFSVHEGQLHLVAKLLEYSFNYSRFLPNWRAMPAPPQVHTAAAAAVHMSAVHMAAVLTAAATAASASCHLRRASWPPRRQKGL